MKNIIVISAFLFSLDCLGQSEKHDPCDQSILNQAKTRVNDNEPAKTTLSKKLASCFNRDSNLHEEVENSKEWCEKCNILEVDNQSDAEKNKLISQVKLSKQLGELSRQLFDDEVSLSSGITAGNQSCEIKKIIDIKALKSKCSKVDEKLLSKLMSNVLDRSPAVDGEGKTLLPLSDPLEKSFLSYQQSLMKSSMKGCIDPFMVEKARHHKMLSDKGLGGLFESLKKKTVKVDTHKSSFLDLKDKLDLAVELYDNNLVNKYLQSLRDPKALIVKLQSGKFSLDDFRKEVSKGLRAKQDENCSTKISQAQTSIANYFCPKEKFSTNDISSNLYTYFQFPQVIDNENLSTSNTSLISMYCDKIDSLPRRSKLLRRKEKTMDISPGSKTYGEYILSKFNADGYGEQNLDVINRYACNGDKLLSLEDMLTNYKKNCESLSKGYDKKDCDLFENIIAVEKQKLEQAKVDYKEWLVTNPGKAAPDFSVFKERARLSRYTRKALGVNSIQDNFTQSTGPQVHKVVRNTQEYQDTVDKLPASNKKAFEEGIKEPKIGKPKKSLASKSIPYSERSVAANSTVRGSSNVLSGNKRTKKDYSALYKQLAELEAQSEVDDSSENREKIKRVKNAVYENTPNNRISESASSALDQRAAINSVTRPKSQVNVPFQAPIINNGSIGTNVSEAKAPDTQEIPKTKKPGKVISDKVEVGDARSAKDLSTGESATGEERNEETNTIASGDFYDQEDAIKLDFESEISRLDLKELIKKGVKEGKSFSLELNVHNDKKNVDEAFELTMTPDDSDFGYYIPRSVNIKGMSDDDRYRLVTSPLFIDNVRDEHKDAIYPTKAVRLRRMIEQTTITKNIP